MRLLHSNCAGRPVSWKRIRLSAVIALVRDASSTKEATMKKWSDPVYCDIRLGFEVTAYVYVR